MYHLNTCIKLIILSDILGALVIHQWIRKHESKPLPWLLSVISIVPNISIIILSSQTSFMYSTFISIAVFFGALFTSILIYRVSPFHPLAGVPGPLLCKLSKFWLLWVARGGKLHLYYQQLHKKYGSIVRVGPNEISIADANLIPFILGSKGIPRGPMWDGRRLSPNHLKPLSIISVRSAARHSRLRKIWNKAFAPGPVRDYGELLVGRANQLIEMLKATCQRSPQGICRVNFSKLFNQLTFDFMSDMAFGGGFELLRDDDPDGVWHALDSSLIPLQIMQYIPWVGDIIRALMQFSNGKGNAFKVLAHECAQRRAKELAKQKDLFYHMGKAIEADPDIPFAPFLTSNVILAMVAGSDTSAIALSNCFYYLCTNPNSYRKLREEIDGAIQFSDWKRLDHSVLQGLPLLNAVINETLRLHTVVPTGIQRAPEMDSGGKMIGDLFVPEGTAVTVPIHVLHRDPKYFSPRADEFWPERWLASTNDVLLNKEAYMPFSTGPANCVGKAVALMELRYLLTVIMRIFDVALDENYNPAQWEQDLQDCYVLLKGPLPVKLTVRNK